MSYVVLNDGILPTGYPITNTCNKPRIGITLDNDGTKTTSYIPLKTTTTTIQTYKLKGKSQYDTLSFYRYTGTSITRYTRTLGYTYITNPRDLTMIRCNSAMHPDNMVIVPFRQMNSENVIYISGLNYTRTFELTNFRLSSVGRIGYFYVYAHENEFTKYTDVLSVYNYQATTLTMNGGPFINAPYVYPFAMQQITFNNNKRETYYQKITIPIIFKNGDYEQNYQMGSLFSTLSYGFGFSSSQFERATAAGFTTTVLAKRTGFPAGVYFSLLTSFNNGSIINTSISLKVESLRLYEEIIGNRAVAVCRDRTYDTVVNSTYTERITQTTTTWC